MKNRMRIKLNAKLNLDLLVFWFCVLDIIFIPFFYRIAVAYSLPVVLLWTVYRFKHIFVNKINKYLLCACGLMIISLVMCEIFNPIAHKITISNTVVIIQGFCYYWLFEYTLKRNDININLIFWLFVGFVFVMVTLYFINPDYLFTIVVKWNPRGNQQLLELYNRYKRFGQHWRYSFIWQDPNNIAYIIVSITTYIWVNLKSSVALKLYSLLTCCLVLVAAMSTGGMLAAGMIFCVLSVYLLSRCMRGCKLPLRKLVLSILLLFLAVVAACYFANRSEQLSSGIFMSFIERLENSSASHRTEIYIFTLQNNNFLLRALFGFGATVSEGEVYSTHSAHLLLILQYGFPVFVIYNLFAFLPNKRTKWTHYLWMISVFLGFSINILITGAKELGIMMLLLALYRNEQFVEDMYNNYENDNVYLQRFGHRCTCAESSRCIE